MNNQIMDKPLTGAGLSWGTRGNTVDERIREHNRISEKVRMMADKRGAETAYNKTIQQIQIGREYYHR